MISEVITGGVAGAPGAENPVFPPGAEVVAVEVGVVVAAEGTETEKFKKPPRNIKEVLEDIPVPGWPMLVSSPYPLEVAWLPPVSITPRSRMKFVEVAKSAFPAAGRNKTKKPIRRANICTSLLYFTPLEVQSACGLADAIGILLLTGLGDGLALTGLTLPSFPSENLGGLIVVEKRQHP